MQIKIERTLKSSTSIIDEIKQKALEYAAVMGKGIKLEIDVINNGTRKNCKIKQIMDVD